MDGERVAGVRDRGGARTRKMDGRFTVLYLPAGTREPTILRVDAGWLCRRRCARGWAVPPEIQSSLAAKYRAQAQREAALGNHRRAACIFAELLGEFSAAADMLKRGRFFVEAAVIYRERLRNDVAEAECLAEGGFFDEAIAIHERRGRWLEVAALQEKAGRPDAARANCWGGRIGAKNDRRG